MLWFSWVSWVVIGVLRGETMVAGLGSAEPLGHRVNDKVLITTFAVEGAEQGQLVLAVLRRLGASVLSQRQEFVKAEYYLGEGCRSVCAVETWQTLDSAQAAWTSPEAEPFAADLRRLSLSVDPVAYQRETLIVGPAFN